MSDQPAKPNKRRKPLGKAIRHTDEQLDELSQVTPADIEAAAALWRASVKPELRDLLDAKPKDANAK